MHQAVVGRGVVVAQLFKHLARVFVGFEFLCDTVEVLLVPAHVGVADLQQLVERKIDHLVVLQLL